MILSKKVKVHITSRNIKHYLSKNYDTKYDDYIYAKVIDLPNKSMVNIKVECDVCGKKKWVLYQKYTKSVGNYEYYACSQKCSAGKCQKTFLNIYGVTSPLKSDEVKQKSKNTCMFKYNKEYYFQTNIFKEKFKTTSLQRYGVEYPMQSELVKDTFKNTMMMLYGVENSLYLDDVKDKIKKTKITNNIILPDELVSRFKLYKRKVKNSTYKSKKILFKNWDGFDYYDKEYIRDNLLLQSLNRLYPTIDHKIGVLYGFFNDVSPEEIGDISNLCITKKYINSMKSYNIMSEKIMAKIINSNV